MTTEVTTWLHKPQSEGGDFAEHLLYTLWGAYPDAPVGRAILSRIFVEIGRELREHTEPEPPLWYAQRYLDIARSLTTASDCNCRCGRGCRGGAASGGSRDLRRCVADAYDLRRPRGSA